MRAKSVFLISHRLREPLTNVKWLSSMFLKGIFGSLTLEQKKAMKNIYNSNQRMIETVDSTIGSKSADQKER